MSPFDAVAHSLSTVSTGGFSTHDASFGYFNLEKSVGSRKSTQAIGAPGKAEKRLITNQVTTHFSASPCTPISYVSFSRPTDFSRFNSPAEVAYTLSSISDTGKIIAIVAMLPGRLEVFTILVLLSPAFWQD